MKISLHSGRLGRLFEYYGFYLNAIQSNTAESYGCIANMRNLRSYIQMAVEKFTAPLETMVDIVLFEFMGLKGIGPAKKALRRETIMDFIPNWDESDASDKLMKFDQEMHQYLDDRNCVQVKYYRSTLCLQATIIP
ncbi:MAG: hypothetical protein ACLRR6_08875 [Oscillospiraceae bacterium]